MNKEHFKVFFITLDKNNLDERNLTIKGINGLKQVYPPQGQLKQKYMDQKSSMSIYCFEIIKNSLKNMQYDNEKQKYIAKIKFEEKKLFNKKKYDGIFLFDETRNNFIFDFKCEHKQGLDYATCVALSKKLSQTEQLKLYIEFLKSPEDQKIVLDLIEDAKSILIKGNYEFTFFLDIFIYSYLINPMKDLLLLFKIENIFPKEQKIDPKNYSMYLDFIETDPGIINQHFSKDDIQEKYYKQFYTVLLYFRYKYEKEKVDDLLSKKGLWLYFKEIIPYYYKTFEKLKLPEGLIKEMANQNIEYFQTIEGIIYYLKSFEKILIFINQQKNVISDLSINEKKIININGDDIKPNQEDNIENIFNETKKLVKYELENKKFVFIEVKFFIDYANIFYELKNLEKLLLLKKVIEYFKKVDQNLNPEINSKIHNIALEKINNGELKNEKLLDFIKNDDIFFNDEKNYEDIKYRPKEVFKGFDLTNVNESFYDKWKEVKICDKYRFHGNDYYIGEKEMINKINHMKDFGKLLKLYNFENETNLCKLIYNKYVDLLKDLLKKNTIDSCPNFIKDTSLLINILDKNKLGDNFISNIILKEIKSLELIIKILLYFTSNCNCKSQEIIKCISNYFISNIENKIAIFIKEEIINFLLKNSFNEIIEKLSEHFIIKEEELYNEEEPNISFKILEIIKTKNIFVNYELLRNSQYWYHIESLTNKIKSDINDGKIQYSYIKPIFKSNKKKQIFFDKIKILLTASEQKIEEYNKNIEEWIKNIDENIQKLMKFEEVLCFFFEENYKNYILDINDVKDKLMKGKLNTLETNYVKEKLEHIEQINNFIPDFEKIYELKPSALFLKLFLDYKFHKITNNTKENILYKSKKDFEQFIILFQKKSIAELNDNCLKAIKELDDDKIEKELDFMKEYFDLNKVNDVEILQLKKDIIMFKKEISKNAFNISLKYKNYDSDKLIDEPNFECKNKQLEKHIINELSIKEKKLKDLNDKIKQLEAFCDKNEILNKLNKISILPFEPNGNEKSNIVIDAFNDGNMVNIIYDNNDKILQMFPEYEGKNCLIKNGIYFEKK